MPATKTNAKPQRKTLQLEEELYERISEEAARQERTVKTVAQKIILAGLEVVRRDQQPSAA